MMALCEHLIQSAARDIGVLENCRLPSGESVDLSAPFRRISLFDAVREIGDCGLSSFSDLKDIARREQIENFESLTEDEILAELFETRVEPRLVRPTFVTHFPASLSPLARRDPENPRFAERFELFVDGQEIANAYSEQNDPLEQKARFEEQILKADSGETARKIDTDYLRALEHGMPPAGGLGIGIDRLVMVLTGTPSIREVILFPLMRPEE
jgi:lysyl-tRNA synthetase class 2